MQNFLNICNELNKYSCSNFIEKSARIMILTAKYSIKVKYRNKFYGKKKLCSNFNKFIDNLRNRWAFIIFFMKKFSFLKSSNDRNSKIIYSAN